MNMTLNRILRTWAVVAFIVTPLMSSAAALVGHAASSSHYEPHAPLRILGNSDFTSVNGVTGGTGTPSDPYVIEGWEIDALGGTGILIKDSDVHFVIRDVRVHSAIEAIFLGRVANGRIEEATIVSSDTGIGLGAVANVSVSTSYISSSSDVAVFIFLESKEVRIQGNTIQGSRQGLTIGFSSSLVLRGNTFLNNTGAVLLTGANDVIIDGNNFGPGGEVGITSSLNVTMKNNSFDHTGFYLTGETLPHFNSHTIDRSNLVNDRPIHYYKDCSGITLANESIGQLLVANCTNFRAQGLAISNTSFGISLAFVRGASIQDNTVSFTTRHALGFFRSSQLMVSRNNVAASPKGIIFWSSFDVTLDSNVVRENGRGIHLVASTRLTIINNTVSENEVGIAFDITLLERMSGDASIEKNDFSGNGEGISLAWTTNVRITKNQIAGNLLGLHLTFSQDIIVYRNNIISNDVQARDNRGAENSWHADYPLGGNYWSDYTGSDECEGPGQATCPGPDGFGDLPYVIDSDSRDLFPLIQPYAPPDLTKPMIAITFPLEGSVLDSVLVTVRGSATDDIALERVEISGDGTLWKLANGTGTWVGNLTLGPGQNVIYARATDTSGNSWTTSISVTVAFDQPSRTERALILLVVVTLALGILLLLFSIRSMRTSGR